MFNKKGMMGMMGPRKIISWVLGLILLVLGLLPLLNKLGVIGFSIPALPGIILWILAVAGGVFLIIDGFKESQSFGMGKILMMFSFIVGIAVLVFGLIPLLSSAGIIGFALPNLAEIIVNILFTIGGFLLIIGGFMGF